MGMYWQPHIVISNIGNDGEDMYRSGVSEVYFEDGKVSGWTNNELNPSFCDEDLDFALRENFGLMVIYNRALSNTIYIEKKDAEGNLFLEEYKKSFLYE